MAEIWRLEHHGRTVAELEVVDGGFPWLTAVVHPLDGFAEVVPLFAEELRRLNELNYRDDESPEWTAAYGAIRAQTALLDPDGNPVAEYLLHLDGAMAWWRWHDEPFCDEE